MPDNAASRSRVDLAYARLKRAILDNRMAPGFQAFEAELIRQALRRTDGNRTHAAKLLGISHRALLYKLKDYRIRD